MGVFSLLHFLLVYFFYFFVGRLLAGYSSCKSTFSSPLFILICGHAHLATVVEPSKFFAPIDTDTDWFEAGDAHGTVVVREKCIIHFSSAAKS